MSNQQKKPKQNHLLEGAVVKSIVVISVPIIFANVLQTVYQLIDTFWVGRLGAGAMASVSLSFPILFFLISLAMGFTMGGSILIAQYNGRGDKENVSMATSQTFSLVLLVSIIFGFIGHFISGFLLSYLTDDPVVLSQAIDYLQISFWAMPATFIYAVFQASLRSVGEVKLPMIIILITVIINFFIDPIFMYGWRFIPEMGVAGVAFATLITEYLSAVIAILIMISNKYGSRLEFKDLLLKKEWVKKIIQLGFPSAVEMSSRSFGIFLTTFIVSTLGTFTVAVYGIGTRILSFIIIPAIGFSIATSTLVGNNLGARQHGRAEEIVKSGIKIAFWTLFFLGVLLFIFAKQVSAFFIPLELEVIAESAKFIRIMAFTFGFIGIQMTISGALKASGQTTSSMLLVLFHTFSLFVLAYLLSTIFNFAELGIWLAYPFANILAFLLALYFYKQKKWLKKELV